MSPSVEVGIVIPTHNAEHILPDCLGSILDSALRPKVLVIDSSSRDRTRTIARRMGAEVIRIDKRSFNHGGTREYARRQLNCEIVVMITQDARLKEPEGLEKLVGAFEDASVVAAYGRQLPRPDARPIGAHARLFNYPAHSGLKSMDDAGRLGIKTPFISNSFAAYRQKSLDAIGGFPGNVIVGEDIYAAASMLLEGGRIAYVGDAEVYHSHEYGCLQEFRRYFDIGVFYRRCQWIYDAFGQAEHEGGRFFDSEMKYLLASAPHLIFPALFRTVLKYGGYRLGKAESILPVGLKRTLSMHPDFWRSAVNGPFAGINT
jgi:rhamnosyltransferase